MLVINVLIFVALQRPTLSGSFQLKAVGGKLVGTFVPQTTGCNIIILITKPFGEYYLTMFSSVTKRGLLFETQKRLEFSFSDISNKRVMRLYQLCRLL